MNEIDILQMVIDGGQVIIFLYLFWVERKRANDEHSARIQDYKSWTDTLTSIIVHRQNATPPLPIVTPVLLQNEREGQGGIN